jgi:hypothetical protein
MLVNRRVSHVAVGLLLASGAIAALAASCDGGGPIPQETVAEADQELQGSGVSTEQNALDLVAEGRTTFRFDTFGDEAFWGGKLRLHDAIKGAALGGVGPGVSPAAALGLGLKVDVEALPQGLRQQILAGNVDLDDPAVTVELLRLNAVVGLRGFFCPAGDLDSIGIQCALCHSTVDDSFAPGVGVRRDGWPNRDLNVGAIITSAPRFDIYAAQLGMSTAAARTVLLAWGPGKFDAELALDGKGFQPNGRSAATLLPAALGLAGVNLHTYTGWGSVPYWNAFVANIAMRGIGTFFDPRLDNPTKFPLAVARGLDDIRNKPDRISPTLSALHVYQLALPIPQPPAGFFNPAAAARGQALFNGKAKCATCHVPPQLTEPGWNMHTGAEICIDNFQARRSPDERYRTTPLRGLFIRTKGGFYHDGRFPTLGDVVAHYNGCLSLGLGNAERSDLVEYVKSL